MSVEVICTPGHTTDSVSFLLADDGPAGSVLTGDTILGRGTTVIAPPDGSLGAYLHSLRLLAGLGPRFVLPAHGPQLPDLSAVAAEYLAHREQRLSAIREVLARLGPDATVGAVTDAVYTDIDPRCASPPSIRWPLSSRISAGTGPGPTRAVTDRRHAAGAGRRAAVAGLPALLGGAAPRRRGGRLLAPGIGSTWPGRATCRCSAPRPRTDTGDSAEMVAARVAFLGEGHYRPIAEAIADRVGGRAGAGDRRRDRVLPGRRASTG